MTYPVTTNTDLGGNAEEGMKLLSKKARGLHPRAQVASLKRIAQRALTMRDWDKYKNQRSEMLVKAKNAIAAMQKLNRDHHLGY